MKKLIFSLSAIFVLLSCNFSGNKQAGDQNNPETELQSEQREVLTVETLMANPEVYVNQTISLQGLCVHTCKHSGKKLFLQGPNEDELIMVFAEGDITAFEQELTGSQVIVTGLLTAREDEAEENHEEGHTCETDSKSKSYQLSCTAYQAVSE